MLIKQTKLEAIQAKFLLEAEKLEEEMEGFDGAKIIECIFRLNHLKEDYLDNEKKYDGDRNKKVDLILLRIQNYTLLYDLHKSIKNYHKEKKLIKQ